ncbi:hypothetical protein BDZ97DRAFT_1141718 [Flammula alnicola]|nr:hypothetical protein BDZ97DRAFT_1141718 [Flammula alnicola]
MLTLFNLGLAVVLVSIISIFIGNNNAGFESGYIELTSCSNSSDLNTSVIVLNWSRPFNVNKIVAGICESLLDNTVLNIIIWNNNPKALSFEDFSNTLCPETALRIINSPENLYFQARYMACAQATTPYCFIQDDDYLIRPEIIQALASRMSNTPLSSIHLQPPNEMLSSQLRTTIIGQNIHTTFAWLGYGTIIKRSRAVQFLSLLDRLDLSEEQRKMADNYFTILSNDIPERWFDAGIELGGGQPFTVGVEGEERNNRHILKAAELLDSVDSVSALDNVRNHNFPYIQSPQQPLHISRVSRSPCHGRVCIFETSIKLLPDDIYSNSSASAITEILELEKRRFNTLGEDTVSNYMRFPPCNAVDGVRDTAFRSFTNAKRDDWMMLDITRTIVYGEVQLVLEVEEATESILRKSTFESSKDGTIWDVWHQHLICTNLPEPEHGKTPRLKACSLIATNAHARYFRVRLLQDMEKKWVVHEMHIQPI